MPARTIWYSSASKWMSVSTECEVEHSVHGSNPRCISSVVKSGITSMFPSEMGYLLPGAVAAPSEQVKVFASYSVRRSNSELNGFLLHLH